jgi:hypothetical protein
MEALFNRHTSDFRSDFTIEFDVKFPNLSNISEEDLQFEWETGHFTNSWAKECFEKLEKVCKSRRWELTDWSFAGRSNGWFALLCKGDIEAVTQKQLGKLETLVEHYFNNYSIELSKCYPNS